MRSVRIVATLGPASSSPGVLDRMIEAGMNVARMNFSHGSHDNHRERIRDLRERADLAGRPVAILQDLQGPKIRTGVLAGGGPVELLAGEPLTLTTREIEGDASCVHVSYENLPRDVRPGDRILISDGLIEVRVESCDETDVRTRIVNGGALKERQGINLPGVRLTVPGLTDKDIADLEFGLSQKVDYVAISFVRTAADIRRVREIIAANDSDAQVIAKLEKPEAVENLEAILDEADGAMVARGDLGVEVSPEKVPLLQKRIITECNRRSKPVITATQMLESMITNPRPTRAEASDVANAVLDGTDALMLSGETAVGAWPVLAVETMARIAKEIQDSDPRRWESGMRPWAAGEVSNSPEAIAAAVASIVRTLDEVDAIWVYTQTATTARLISHHRPHVPIMGFTPDERVWRRMALYWGVTPILTGPARSASDFDRQIVPLVIEKGLCHPGDTVLITGSHPFERTAPTNFLKIQRIE